MAKTKLSPTPLFPILNSHPGPRLLGIARLAAESTHTDDGHLIDFRSLQPRTILNRSVSRRNLRHTWSINPFRGCEFGCKYCFARYTHEFLQPAPITTPPKGTYDIPQQPWALAFEHEIYLKENAAWLLEQELRTLAPRIAENKEEIAIGTATDPYQPIERRVGITRSILEVLARQQGLRIGIITKSSLITRDIDLLLEIAAHNKLAIHITITTTDAALARKLEPRAPRPDLRFAALRKLCIAGLNAGVLCSPLLPGINDSIASIDAVAARAAAAGACFLGANPLFLKSCSRPTFLNFIREHLPHLADDYNRRYATADFVDPTYRNRLASITRQICRKHHLGERNSDSYLIRDTYIPQPIPKSKPEKSPTNSATNRTTNRPTENSLTRPSTEISPTRKPPTPARAPSPQANLFATG
ncbi:MAG: radical SAM protein [Acidobacteriaceae bacterium]